MHKILIINISLISIFLVWISKHKLKIKLNKLVTKKNPTKLKKFNLFFYSYLFYQFLFEQLPFYIIAINSELIKTKFSNSTNR